MFNRSSPVPFQPTRALRVLLAAGVVTTLAACTWVQPSTGSHQVSLRSESDVVNCVKKGITTSKTLSKILFIPRSPDKQFNELVLLAKNEAVILRGDAVVPEGRLQQGSQDFGVYLCR